MQEQLAVVEFKTEYPPGRDPIDMVLLAPKGEAFEKTRTWRRVSKLKPDPHADANKKASLTYQHMAAIWSVVEPNYEQWKSGNEIPESGTPLAAWGALTKEQADAFRAMGCKVVEDVAALGPDSAARLPFPGARRLPELAERFLSTASGVEKDEEIESLKAKMAQMEAMLADKPKRGPGRPRKEANE